MNQPVQNPTPATPAPVKAAAAPVPAKPAVAAPAPVKAAAAPAAAEPPTKEPSITGSFEEEYEAHRHPKPDAPDATPAPTITEKIENTASNVGSKAGELADTAGKKVKGFWDSLMEGDGLGKIAGAAVGLLGTWFLSGIFSDGGILGTILMICLAIPLMMMGSAELGPMFNRWMGKGDKDPQVARSPEVGGPQTTIASSKDIGPSQALMNTQLNAMLDATHHRVHVVRDANHAVDVHAVPDSAPDAPGMYDLAQIKAIEAKLPNAQGIAFIPDQSPAGFTPVPVLVRNVASNQR